MDKMFTVNISRAQGFVCGSSACLGSFRAAHLNCLEVVAVPAMCRVCGACSEHQQQVHASELTRESASAPTVRKFASLAIM